MSRARIVWADGFTALPSHELFLHAVPGVGNVGKLLVDTLVSEKESRLVARMVHPDLPPHATLNDEGMLVPPCLAIHEVELKDGVAILALTSNFQPITPAGQFEAASALLQLCADADVGRMLILAGLSAEPGSEEVHVVCPTSEDKEAMESLGLNVTGEHPSAGIIGMTGLVASLAPTYGVASTCIIAETVGTSVDTVSADRMVRFVSENFNLNLAIELDKTEETAERLREFFDLDEVAELPTRFEGGETDTGFYA